MDINVNEKSGYILKGKMLSMFSPFSHLSPFEMTVLGLMVYYGRRGKTLTDDTLVGDIVTDTGKSRQVIYNTKVSLKKKGLIKNDAIVENYYKMLINNEFKFNFRSNGKATKED